MMYSPFPGNYVWNLSVNICVAMGGAIGEIDQANTRILEAATHGDDAGTEEFFASWIEMAERLRDLGAEAQAEGNARSAVEKYLRSVGYYLSAERMQRHDYTPRKAAYRAMLDTMAVAKSVGNLNCERVEIPYGDTSFPALFVRGHGQGPRPCMVFCNGLDSIKECIYLCIRQELAVRGISCLMVDQPGVGEALRLKGLCAVVEAERWASAAVDFLEGQSEVDADRIGMMGWSLGGYFAPRAAAFEKRFKLCVAWGANHNWGELQRRRLAREGDRPVPHYWEHVMWVWGQENLDQFMAFAPAVSLVGVVKNITVPFLITHGVGDRQIPLEYAHQCYAEAVGSPRRELKIFTSREGGVEHCSADNMEPARSYIAGWIEKTFAECYPRQI
jgi:dienelactone hydrolase